MRKILTLFSFSLVLIVLTAGCMTTRPYQGMVERLYDSGSVYTMGNNESGKVIIYLEGSGYESVLGRLNEKGKWDYTRLGDYLARNLGDEYAVMIPEKFSYEPGRAYYGDTAALAQYTAENLIDCYSRKIDAFLEENDFSEVILMGTSEGGALVPAVFSALDNKASIDRMIVFAGGGLNQKEEFRILAASPLPMHEGYRKEMARVDEAWEEIQNDPEATDKFYLGHPYVRWDSFFRYTPLDYYPLINIPVLFIQGEKDTSVPVESTLAIEKAHISEDFTFIYYPEMNHGPGSNKEMRRIFQTIGDWLYSESSTAEQGKSQEE